MLKEILNYSEVWALLIPVSVWVIKKSIKKILYPVKVFLIGSMILNIVIELAHFKQIYHNNNPVYNLSSIFRLGIFVWFFSINNIPAKPKQILFPAIILSLFFIANYFFIDSFIKFSSTTFSIEGVILIVYCIVYFLKKLREDKLIFNFDPSLIIITGLAIYEAVCFPIFLFYQTLVEQTKDYAVNIWDVHNIAYIVFCLFIARAFYGSSRYTTK